jgi:hypothetical protein
MELDTVTTFSRMLTLGWQPLGVSTITARQNYALGPSDGSFSDEEDRVREGTWGIPHLRRCYLARPVSHGDRKRRVRIFPNARVLPIGWRKLPRALGISVNWARAPFERWLLT